MPDIYVNPPKIRIKDSGEVILSSAYADTGKIYYTTDGSTPTRSSAYLENRGGSIGTFARGTVIKAMYSHYVTWETRDSQGNITASGTDLFDSEPNVETVLEPTNFNVNIQFADHDSSQRYVYLTGEGILLGTLYVTFDGSDPRSNGVIWPHGGADSSSWVGWKDCTDYKCRCILRYGTYYSNEIEFTRGNPNFTILDPTITYDDTNYRIAITNPNPSTLESFVQYRFVNADGTFTDWKTYTTRILTTAYQAVEARVVKNLPSAPEYKAYNSQYSNTIRLVLGASAPTISQKIVDNSIVMSASEGSTIYYTVNGTDPSNASTVYSGPISADNMAEGTIIKAIAYKTLGGSSRASDITSYTFTYNCLQAPTIKFNGRVITIIENNSIGDIHYTIDNSTPTQASDKFYTGFVLSESTTVKAKVFFTIEHNTYYSSVTSKYYDYSSENANKPDIKLNGSEDVPLVSGLVMSYVDIIFTDNYENPKALNALQYVLNSIEEPFGLDNPTEEVLDRRFEGDYILIYSDECYSGILDIKSPEPLNSLNAYKYPYWDKGKWNFNYFRNNITKPVTEEELEGYTTFPYYNPETRQNEIKNISLAQLKQANRYINNGDRADQSDNRSLIFGKYFVVRFIFKNTKKVKLETLDINCNAY